MQNNSIVPSSGAQGPESEASLVFHGPDNIKFFVRASTAIADFKHPIPLIKLRHASLFSSKLVSKFNITSGDIFKEGAYPARIVTFGDLPTCANIYPSRVVAYGMGSGAVEVLVRRTAKQAIELTQAAVETVVGAGPIITRDIVASSSLPILAEVLAKDPIALFRAATMYPEECRYFSDVRPYMILKVPLSRCFVVLFESQPTYTVPFPHNAIFYNCSSRNDVILSYKVVQQVLMPGVYLPAGAKLGHGVSFLAPAGSNVAGTLGQVGKNSQDPTNGTGAAYYSEEDDEEDEEEDEDEGEKKRAAAISRSLEENVGRGRPKRPRPEGRFAELNAGASSDSDTADNETDSDLFVVKERGKKSKRGRPRKSAL